MKAPRLTTHTAQSPNTPRRDASVADTSRRDFVRRLTAGLCLPFAVGEQAVSGVASSSPGRLAQAGTAKQSSATSRTESDVGSLWPFIQSQAVTGEFPLSWLRSEFKRVTGWKRKARAKLLELLHYSPANCAPRAEVVERIDAGDYAREKVYFNTTPDIRVPAFVLVPKQAKLPAPGLVALHDHGGFYFWGKEKIVETADEHAVLTDFKKRYYAGQSIASELARQGDVVVVLDYPDVASLAMPNALLVINGSKDGLFELDGVRASFEKLNACYKKAGAPEKCRTRLYDTPREFNAEMQAEAWQWLRRWL